nr:hypothetical protein [Tanacetum cinerariifolium]
PLQRRSAAPAHHPGRGGANRANPRREAGQGPPDSGRGPGPGADSAARDGVSGAAPGPHRQRQNQAQKPQRHPQHRRGHFGHEQRPGPGRLLRR